MGDDNLSLRGWILLAIILFIIAFWIAVWILGWVVVYWTFQVNALWGIIVAMFWLLFTKGSASASSSRRS